MLIKKVIVLGGSGFLGSRIIKKLSLNPKLNVYYGGRKRVESLTAKHCELNMLNRDSLKILKDFDIIINCTGQITKPFNLCYQLNTLGSNNLAKTLKHTSKKIIHISSMSVYGSLEKCNESSKINPETNYAFAKAVSDFILQENIQSNNLTILRLTNLYGPNQIKGVIAYILRSYLSDKKLLFNNNGSLFRFYLHVDDCAKLINDFINLNIPSNIYNIKGPDSYELKELIKKFEVKFKTSFYKEFPDISPVENIYKIEDAKLNKFYKFSTEFDLFQYFENQINLKYHA